MLAPLRLARACRSVTRSLRAFSTSAARRDVLADLEEKIMPRELVERKRKAFEDKYGDKLRRRAEAEGVADLQTLKEKVLAPSIEAARRAREEKKAARAREADAAAERERQELAKRGEAVEARRARAIEAQGQGDRSGVRPLSSIVNLPLLHLTPHTSQQIADIWTTYHTTHPTLAASYLCAHLPAVTYASMLSLAQQNPFFVLPLPRGAGADAGYEIFYLQWLFHATPSGPGGDGAPLPPTTSVIFTPLEEFKRNGEWAQPYLTLTHYPDLGQTHGLVLMRGEITPAFAAGSAGGAASQDNPGFVLSQQEAQLLSLALQRFYCSAIAVQGEGDRGRAEREERASTLRDFKERPGEWDWEGLVSKAYGGHA
ncbi:hypothetical protein Q5752_004177 [Cryptotrichosporon argae]